MGELMLIALKLVVVLGIQKTASGSLITFQGGRGALVSTHREYSYSMKLAERSLERKQPVGIAISGDEIVEVVRADADIVSRLTEDSERGQLKIWFQGHDGTFILRYQHPEFKRISLVLQASEHEKKQVWFVARKPLLEIQDAVFLQ